MFVNNQITFKAITIIIFSSNRGNELGKWKKTLRIRCILVIYLSEMAMYIVRHILFWTIYVEARKSNLALSFKRRRKKNDEF